MGAIMGGGFVSEPLNNYFKRRIAAITAVESALHVVDDALWGIGRGGWWDALFDEVKLWRAGWGVPLLSGRFTS
jgi:hypothetical protein